MDRDILLEALSTLTGSIVRPHNEQAAGDSTAEELTIHNYLPSVFSGLNLSELAVDSPVHPLRLVGGLQTSTLHKLFVNIENFYDPDFDYDFRRSEDSSLCSRGGEPYTRPWGWYRFALRVLDQYPDGNTWLGPDGWRSFSAPGEWPISFHGTSIEGARGIVRSCYQAGPREAYGRGIYSTPDIRVADVYAMSKRFKSQTDGKTYKVIMQNRINPVKRIKTENENYWLIPVPEGTSAAEERKIVETSIRPYGVLLREV